MEGIRRALVLGLVLIARTAIEQAPSVGPLNFLFITFLLQKSIGAEFFYDWMPFLASSVPNSSKYCILAGTQLIGLYKFVCIILWCGPRIASLKDCLQRKLVLLFCVGIVHTNLYNCIS